MLTAQYAFRSREDGNVTIFSVFMLMLILIITGASVDIMRFEATRAKMQSTMDRAVLAAADLEQQQPPVAVVNDYMTKAGLAQGLSDVAVNEGLNFRNVRAEGSAALDTFFLHMSGFDELVAPALSEAEEVISEVEISLVLDISGSMRFGDRIGKLKPAAETFVDTVLLRDDSMTSVTVVPYAGQTNPGPVVYDYLNTVEPENRAAMPSSCIEVPRSNFDTTGLPPDFSDFVPHFMYWSIAADVMDWGWCPEDDTSIQYFGTDADALGEFIRDIRMHDGTGTHYGLKWALSLLSPEARPMMNHLIDNGEADESQRGRPLDWEAEDAQKFIVLMTDGKITDQLRPKDPYHEDNWDRELQRQDSDRRERLSRRSENLSAFYEQCDLAKDNGVIVFTIAYEAPSNGRNEMRNCASSPSHFFEVEGVQIEETFHSIARQINNLRLVQ